MSSFVNLEYNNTNIVELLGGLNDLNKYLCSIFVCIRDVINQHISFYDDDDGGECD